MNSFKELPLLPVIQKALDAVGFTKPTEVQAKTIPLLVENFRRDVHAQAQTGTGKTLAFGIPLLQAIEPSVKAVQGLVIAPTRELVMQIYESLKEVSRETGIAIEPVYGGMPIDRQIRNIKRGAQIIVGTPGRLNDHLRRKTMSLKLLKILVLDEADIMLDMGFKQEIDAILDRAPKSRHIWLFSATVKPGIKQLISSHMKNVLSVKAAAKGIVTTQVKQYYCLVPGRKRTEVAARFIEATPDFYGIIFCQTKTLTAEVTEKLASKGFRVNCLHGDMSQALRNRVIQGFRNKDFNILVATDVAARGIDVSDLTHVINFSIPEEHENYIHRIGRTGRAGKEGTAIVLVAPSEMYRVRRLERAAKTTLQEIPIPQLDAIVSAKMGAVSDFIEQSKVAVTKDSPVQKPLKEMIDSFTEEEIRHSFARALEDKFFKDILHENLESVSSKEVTGAQEICMELGRDDGFSEDEMRGYLYSTCKLLPQQVRKVRVLNHKTFISIPENRLKECMELMRKSPVTEQRHKIYIVEDVYRERSQRGGSAGRHGRRHERPSSDRQRSGRQRMNRNKR